MAEVRTEEVWIYLAHDPETEREYVLGWSMDPSGDHIIPAVYHSQEEADEVMATAEQMSQIADLTIRLAKFSSRTDLKEIKP